MSVKRKKNQDGFTMIELLVTMVLLAIVLTGLAPLQVYTIRQVANSRRVGEATRLASAVLERYKTTTMASITTTTGWAPELKKDGVSTMVNVAVDGEGSGPFTVDRFVEDVGGGTRRLIMVRASWLDQTPGASTVATDTYQVRNVIVATQRAVGVGP